MSQQTIDIGTAANNGTGDPLRTGGAKINANFDELYAATGNPNLLALSGLIGAADRLPYFTGVGALSLSTLTAYSRQLLALTSASEWKGVGGLALVKADVDLSEVDNTSDVDKPVSTAVQSALDGKQAANDNLTALASVTADTDRIPIFTGVNTAGFIPAEATGKSLLATATQDAAQTAIGASALGKSLIAAAGSTLSPALGGTGVASIAALLTSLQSAGAYGKTNAVGTVSQSGGTPTGAIIESGSNTNGDYIKYADGTMICRYIHSVRLVTSSSQGSVYLSPTGQQLTFPMPFVSPPAVAPCPTYDGVGVGRAWLSNNQPTTDGVLMVSHGPTNTASCYPGYVATGRWY